MFRKDIGVPLTSFPSFRRTYKISRRNKKLLYFLAFLYLLVVSVSALLPQILTGGSNYHPDAMVYQPLRSP